MGRGGDEGEDTQGEQDEEKQKDFVVCDPLLRDEGKDDEQDSAGNEEADLTGGHNYPF